jgi:hypothetical protein
VRLPHQSSPAATKSLASAQFRKVNKIEGSDDTVRDQLLVRDERQVDTVPVDRFSAHVDPAPARLGAIINPNGGICAIKYPVSDIERQTIETPVGHQVPGRKMS